MPGRSRGAVAPVAAVRMLALCTPLTCQGPRISLPPNRSWSLPQGHASQGRTHTVSGRHQTPRAPFLVPTTSAQAQGPNPPIRPTQLFRGGGRVTVGWLWTTGNDEAYSYVSKPPQRTCIDSLAEEPSHPGSAHFRAGVSPGQEEALPASCPCLKAPPYNERESGTPQILALF